MCTTSGAHTHTCWRCSLKKVRPDSRAISGWGFEHDSGLPCKKLHAGEESNPWLLESLRHQF